MAEGVSGHRVPTRCFLGSVSPLRIFVRHDMQGGGEHHPYRRLGQLRRGHRRQRPRRPSSNCQEEGVEGLSLQTWPREAEVPARGPKGTLQQRRLRQDGVRGRAVASGAVAGCRPRPAGQAQASLPTAIAALDERTMAEGLFVTDTARVLGGHCRGPSKAAEAKERGCGGQRAEDAPDRPCGNGAEAASLVLQGWPRGARLQWGLLGRGRARQRRSRRGRMQ